MRLESQIQSAIVAAKVDLRSKWGTKLQSQEWSMVKVGQTQRWLTSDERRSDMIKKERTKSRGS